MQKKLQIIFLLVLSLQSVIAQETFKTMFYNVLNFPNEDAVLRTPELAVILGDYQPDIFMICELNDETGANTILNTLQTVDPNFQRATFFTNTSDDSIGDSNDLQQMLFYDSSKFSLESFTINGSPQDQFIISTLFRDFNHYKLKLNTTNQASNPVFLNVIVCHLKASMGVTNQQSRLAMVEDLEAYLETLPSNEYVMLAGDLNLYESSEPAFLELLNTDNNITFIDPADRIGDWHNNTDFIDVMTQSTRTQSGLGGGSTGGFDDRFDFILTSENMQTATELSFVNGSYKVFGNNANINCYNDEINSTNCSGAEFSEVIRDALYNFSDHLPVTLELQTDQTLGTDTFVSDKLISFIGRNIVDATIKLKVNKRSLNINKLTIFNVLGQEVKTIPLNNSIYITNDISNLQHGIYYITAPNVKMQPLKFIKID